MPNQPAISSQAVDPFLDQLIKDLKLDQLPEPQQNEILSQVKDLAERRLLQIIVANLSEQALAELRQKMESGAKPEEISTWLALQPGLREKVEQELKALYEGLVRDAQAAAGSSENQPLQVPPAS